MSARYALAGLSLILCFIVAACGGAAAPAPSTAPAAPNATAATALPEPTTAQVAATAAPAITAAPTGKHTQYPVTIKDCDRTLTFDKAPERVVTFDPAVTEILLVLGLKNRIAGITLFDDGPKAGDKMWSVTKAEIQTLPIINDPKIGYPSKEKIVSIKPDLVTSEYPSAFDANYGVATIEQFTQFGIPVYLTQGGCSSTPVWNDLSILYQDIRDFGVIFDVQDRADTEIAKLQGQVAALQQKVKDAHVPNYSIGTHCCGSDTVGSLGTTTANAIITLAGSHYTFVDIDNGKTPISWEVFVKRSPDVIWLITGLGMTADEIQKMLESDPRTAVMPAVKNKRFVTVAYDDVGESPRIIDGLTALVNGLIALNNTAQRTQYPVTITDCGGRTTTYDKAPERVVTIDPSVTEMLLVLGLKDKIVGYTEFFTPERQWATTKADMQTLRMINDGANYPSKEAIVAVKPDLITSVYSYAFADPLPERTGWDTLGIHTYQALGSCTTDGLPSDLAVLYQDMRNFGILFDVQARAETEISNLQQRVIELQQKAKAAGIGVVRVAPYDGFDKQPTYYGGMEQAVLTLAGATYIWANADPNVSPSWEQFIATNPQVIWIIPDAGVPVDELKHRLETDPRFTAVAGIKNKAYIIVPQADATIESPRLVDGIEQVVNGLIALK